MCLLESFQIHAIGKISSPYKQRFAIPRQSLLAEKSHAVIRLNEDADFQLATRGLEEFSHIWVIFVFHELKVDRWKPLVKPPRLGGKKTVGVFASRSPFRPNSLGLSLVKLEKVEVTESQSIALHVCGGDFLDGTPVIDIKPYLKYSECQPESSSAWAEKQPERMPVKLNQQSFASLKKLRPDDYLRMKAFLEESLSYDPRPAYETSSAYDGGRWGSQFENLEVKWTVNNNTLEIVSIDKKDI